MVHKKLKPFVDEIRQMATSANAEEYQQRLGELNRRLGGVLSKYVKKSNQVIHNLSKHLHRQNIEPAIAVLESAEVSRVRILFWMAMRLGVPLLVGIVGGAISIFLVYQQGIAEESTGWPATGGWVVSSYVEQKEQGGLSRGDNMDWDQPTTYYVPVVVYSYVVNGQTYSSNRFTYKALGQRREDAQQWVARYPRGAQVAVHYDPANPSLATLEVGSDPFVLAIAILVALGSVIGAVVMFIRIDFT